MSQILHIDVSPRSDRSVSRNLAQEFITGWQAAHPDDTFVYRDFGKNPPPYVDENWIGGAFTPAEEHSPEQKNAIAISDAFVDEFLAADRYVFSIPMYNLTIPATFKAYIDQIIRVGKTFSVDASGYKGLVEGKKLLVIAAHGGVYRAGTPAGGYNLHEPYLRAIFGFIGVTDVTFIVADGLNEGEESRVKSLAEAQEAIKGAIASW